MTIWPKLALTGITITSALLGGIKLGADHVRGKWDGERAWQAIEANKALAANVARLRAADAANAATQARLQTALAKARHEPIQPVQCPASGDVLDAELPGLSLRLRILRDSATTDNPAAGVVGLR